MPVRNLRHYERRIRLYRINQTNPRNPIQDYAPEVEPHLN